MSKVKVTRDKRAFFGPSGSLCAVYVWPPVNDPFITDYSYSGVPTTQDSILAV